MDAMLSSDKDTRWLYAHIITLYINVHACGRINYLLLLCNYKIQPVKPSQLTT